MLLHRQTPQTQHLLTDAEHWTRIYWANRIDRRGIDLDRYLEIGPATILWAALEFDTLKRNPLAGFDFNLLASPTRQTEYLPLLPRQVAVMRRLNQLDESLDDGAGIICHNHAGYRWRPHPRRTPHAN